MTRIYAHRGASKEAPENTMAAFELAVELGAEGFELDVHLSKDGKLVVIHDETLKRTTGVEGYVKQYTYEELKSFDNGSWFSDEFIGSSIPLLEDVIWLVKRKSLLLNIEIKGGGYFYPGIEDEVVEAIKKFDLIDSVVVSSFNHYSLLEIKRLCSDVKTGVLYVAGLYEPWNYAKTVLADAIHPNYITLAPEIIEGAKRNKYLINTYTVDDESSIRKLILAGVDGIITNDVRKAIPIKKRIDKGE